MVKDTLWKGLVTGVRVKFSGESKGLTDRHISLNNKRRCAQNLIRFKDLSMAMIDNTIDTSQSLFSTLQGREGITIMYSGFRHLCKFSLEPQCSTIKGSVIISTYCTETVSLYNYSLWHWAQQVDMQRCVN